MMRAKWFQQIFKYGLFLLFVAGCNFPMPTSTSGQLMPTEIPASLAATQTPAPFIATNTPVFTKTARPTSTATAAPTDVPTNLVWFAPNMGSRDYTDLFTRPEAWAEARQKIDVFKFYTQNLLDAPCSICGSNVLSAFVQAQAFQQLTDWGFAIGAEIGAVKEWGCTGDEEYRVAKEIMDNVQANGGKVTFLAMDEPYIGGELVANGNSCNNTMDQSADATAHFIQQVKRGDAQVLVGDIEPYPYFSVSQLEGWISVLEEQDVSLAFFHLDVDIERVRVEGQNVVRDLQALDLFCQEHGVPFGVIFTSNWRYAGSDRAYFDSTLGWIRQVDQAIGKPQHVIFQSWQGPARDGVHAVPINLPENDADVYSHTRLILDGLEVLLP